MNFINFLTVVIILYSSYVNGVDFSSTLNHIKPGTDEFTQTRAAYNVIVRTIPERAQEFNIKVDFKLPRNSYAIIKNESLALVHITASSGVAACKAFYQYLKYYCNAHISWEGSQLNLPIILPDVNITHTSSSLFIYYQNVCTWSYSFAWWKWSEWQQHIDWIALQGITLTLAPIQELVWSQVYTELGMTQTEIDEHLSGPAFMAWQRMGNIRGWGGPLTRYFKRSSSKLQVKIIKSLRNLGIAVALPAFAGHVPVAFTRIFPDSNFTKVGRWNRFSDEFCCPLYIDPLDPLFMKIGEMFLQKIVQRYGGTDHIYFSDPFNEIQPKIDEPEYLASVSRRISDIIQIVDSKGVWLLQGWMFVKNPFWSDDLIKAFLTAVPLGKILVLDLQSEQSPQYERTKSFYGQPFIWCMLHNFGGTLGMHGSVNILNSRIEEASQFSGSTMYGVGITPEGINQNHIMYEFALERAWNYTQIDTEKWFDQYILGRYGEYSEPVSKAWNILLNTVYSYNGNSTIRGKYIVCKRPSLDLEPFIWYSIKDLYTAWDYFLQTPGNILSNNLFRHDLVDIIRQFFQNQMDIYYAQLIDEYKNGRINDFSITSKNIVQMLNDMDTILRNHKDFLLGTWLESAKNMSNNGNERRIYERNARNQITIWGPTGQIVDYAMKQWSGIIYDYCLPRWKLFFNMTIDAMKMHTKVNMGLFRRKVLESVELPFVMSTKSYTTEPDKQLLFYAREFLQKYRLS